MKRIPSFFLLVILLLSFRLPEARAYVLQEGSLQREALSESVPTAFAPADFDASDFELEWEGKPLENVDARLGEGTLQWVRVDEVLVLPRARLIVEARDIDGGQARNAGGVQPFAVNGGRGRVELPIVLASGEGNAIELVVRRGARELRGRLLVRFHPRRAQDAGKVLLDPSCSRFGVEATASGGGAAPAQWAYVGCRLVSVRAEGHRTSLVELRLFWDNAGRTIEIGGVATPETLESTWLLRMPAEPGRVVARAGDREIALSYHAPETLHLGSLGVGLGPYAFSFSSNESATSTVTPMLTVYGSYSVTEAMRVVAFDAANFTDVAYMDLGLYLETESIRALDRRLTISVMLGGHANGFSSGGTYYVRFGLPQGIEAVYSDAFARGFNLSGGAFIYPLIDGKSYYNAWLRYGTPQFFGEINYISWHESTDSDQFYSRSVGLSFGFPLAKFF